MILRILGEGQYELAEGHLDRLNTLDAVVQSAVDSGDEAAFETALRALLEEVRRVGTPLPDERISPSDLVLPAEDTGLRGTEALLSDEGLIPG